MGIDTRFWGPSGWQLFHLIAFRGPNPEKTLNLMNTILPCPFCRESTTKFMKEHPLGNKEPGKWLYDIHNMVNNKLRTQCREDPSVIDPGQDPEFEEIKERYMAMKPTQVPGRDFLMCVAYNYPTEPTEDDIKIQQDFIDSLRETYPFTNLRKVVQKMSPPNLGSQKSYTRWMYQLLRNLSEEIDVPIRTYKGYMHHVAYYKSGCSKKSYHGKTCRRLSDGSRTKNRDHKKTRRIVGAGLL